MTRGLRLGSRLSLATHEHSWRRLALCLGVLSLIATGPAPAGEADEDPRLPTIRRFFTAMGGDAQPTLADFKQIFGPHNEWEWVLQARFEGDLSLLSEPASDEIVARVNAKYFAPESHRSLFLCFLRQERPELQSVDWRVLRVKRREEVGADDFEVQAGETTLFFSFPFDETYVGRLHDGKGIDLSSAERFLRLCTAGRCCPQGTRQ